MRLLFASSRYAVIQIVGMFSVQGRAGYYPVRGNFIYVMSLASTMLTHRQKTGHYVYWAWDGKQLSWWRHPMETFSALLVLCEDNSLVTGEFPSQWSVMQSFDAFLVCTETNSWSNHRDAGDLRRHRAHYDVTLMQLHAQNSGLILVFWPK